MKIHLMSNDISLGFLTYDKEYVWIPNLNNIKKLANEHPFTIEMLELPTKQTKFSQVPNHYIEYLDASNRKDLEEKAGIKNNDLDYAKLFKMGLLQYSNEEFIIKSEY